MKLTISETDLYYYHPDHLGSSSWITNAGGQAIQHLQYLPFGETRVDQRTTSWSTRYSFSAKEKDEESGYSYFSARYYDSELSIWLSVDPLAHKTPGVSPYAYCVNNPIILHDPDGRDWYTADEQGNITLYKKIEGSKTDHLVVLDRKGNAKVDKNGNLKQQNAFGKQLSQEVKKGTFENIKNEKGHTLIDFDGNKSEASGVFNILADNTSVEWGMVGFESKNGDAQFQVGSSHKDATEESASTIANNYAKEGKLLLYNHSHPYIPSEGTGQGADGGFPSTIPNKDGGCDKSFWNGLLNNSPNARLGIRFRGQTLYYHNK